MAPLITHRPRARLQSEIYRDEVAVMNCHGFLVGRRRKADVVYTRIWGVKRECKCSTFSIMWIGQRGTLCFSTMNAFDRLIEQFGVQNFERPDA